MNDAAFGAVARPLDNAALLQTIRHRVEAAGTSFYWAMRLLPKHRRNGMYAVYAFCREVDDVVDEGMDPQVAAAKLAWWRGEVANLFNGKPQHPVTRALEPHREAFGITAERLNEIIDGMEMDLRQTRYLDWAGLERYCYRVASVVGLLAAGIFGYRDARTLDYAKNLGIAFQLTNIIRDVGEDARKNRVYLPVEDLQRFGVPAADILQAKETPAFRSLMQFEAERARGYYRDAMAALPPEDRRAQRPGLIMAAIYRALLEEIQRDGFHVLTQRTSLTPLRKFWIAWRTWVAA